MWRRTWNSTVGHFFRLSEYGRLDLDFKAITACGRWLHPTTGNYVVGDGGKCRRCLNILVKKVKHD